MTFFLKIDDLADEFKDPASESCKGISTNIIHSKIFDATLNLNFNCNRRVGAFIY